MNNIDYYNENNKIELLDNDISRNSYFLYKDILLGFNMQNSILIDLLILISILCASFTILAKNPIISVLYLIGLYVSVASYIILLGLQFIGLSYILIYVGAISILFIFILMLINIRISELLSNSINSIVLIIIVTSLLNIIFYSILYNKSNIILYNENNNYEYIQDKNIFSIGNIKWDDSIIEYNTISSIGNTLYSDNLIVFLEASLILLLAMIGAIVITIKSTD